MNGTVDEMNSPVKGVHEDGQKSVYKEDNSLPRRRTEKLGPIFKSEAEVYLGNTQPKKTSEAQKRKRVPRKTSGVMGVATEKSRSCLRGWLTTLPKNSRVQELLTAPVSTCVVAAIKVKTTSAGTRLLQLGGAQYFVGL